MAYRCEITGKVKLKGNRVSHANNKKIHYQKPSLKDKSIFVPELGRFTTLRVSSAGLRTLDKVGGLARFILRSNPDTLTPTLRSLRKQLVKS